MRSIPRQDVPVAIADGDVEVRVLDQAGMMVGFIRLPAGADLRPATKGLPDDLCPCPHWGYMLKGRVRMHTTDGHHDFAGEAFYWAPGHALSGPVARFGREAVEPAGWKLAGQLTASAYIARSLWQFALGVTLSAYEGQT